MRDNTNPVVVKGNRVSWDREISLRIAAWLKVMYERYRNQYIGIVNATGEWGREKQIDATAPLFQCMVACKSLISRLDNAWDLTAWQDAEEWVSQVIGETNDNPASDYPASNEIRSGVSDTPGT